MLCFAVLYIFYQCYIFLHGSFIRKQTTFPLFINFLMANPFLSPATVHIMIIIGRQIITVYFSQIRIIIWIILCIEYKGNMFRYVRFFISGLCLYRPIIPHSYPRPRGILNLNNFWVKGVRPYKHLSTKKRKKSPETLGFQGFPMSKLFTCIRHQSDVACALDSYS